MDINRDLQILIGKRILQIRLQKKQTQHDIEFLTGIDSADISKHENGKKKSYFKNTYKICSSFRGSS